VSKDTVSTKRRWLYLPGLGTGWRSVKGQALAARLARYGISLQCVDLRVPTFQTMRVSAMLQKAKEALGNEPQRSVVIGTSLGGFVAAQLAASDPRVEALVLYAPALDLGEVRRQHSKVAWLWEQLGWLPAWDKTERRLRPVDVGLLRELDSLDGAVPDVRAPTLLIHGLRDRLLTPSVSREFARARSNVRLVEFEDGHNLAASQSALLAETERFLAPWLGSPAASR